MTTGNDTWDEVAEQSGDGVMTIQLSGWTCFNKFLSEFAPERDPQLLDYIWRGQRRDDWSISSSLDREFERLGILERNDPARMERLEAAHLERFQYAARGRRGTNPARLQLENDWWALGQHYGLATPLLDWTRSPFAALYFAFEERVADPQQTTNRVVYGLSRAAVDWWNDTINESESYETTRAPVLEIIDPLTDENPRLVNQDGLFTRSPIGLPVEQWVMGAFIGKTDPVLLRIKVPDTDRLGCIRSLRRMNVSHLSLFPDLIGASRYSNLRLETEADKR